MILRTDFLAWSGLPETDPMLGWEFVAYEQDGEVRAIAAVRGTEIHFAIKPEFRNRVITARRARRFLAPLLESRSYLTTRTLWGRSAAFIERLGFKKTWGAAGVDHFMLTDLPFKVEH